MNNSKSANNIKLVKHKWKLSGSDFLQENGRFSLLSPLERLPPLHFIHRALPMLML